MIDHVSVGVSDLLRSMVFYDAVFEALGISRLWTADDAAGYGYPGADEPFAIRSGTAQELAGRSARAHVAFIASNRDAVTAFHTRAVEHGGADEGGAGLHPEYGPGYFAAFVSDPDGNRLEAVLHERQ
ncbi:MAG TPA: VOC family protein [Candidatus Elarobacter sp.]|jgi:catechol 2,3-dioxygenase-like lactoylglutathione lyase family enzyme